jgi:hypothetical protein
VFCTACSDRDHNERLARRRVGISELPLLVDGAVRLASVFVDHVHKIVSNVV